MLQTIRRHLRDGDMHLHNEASVRDQNFSDNNSRDDLIQADAYSLNPLAAIARRIKDGDRNAELDLYLAVKRGMTFWARSSDLNQERLDLAHEIFIKCLVAIRDGQVRDVNCLPGFIRTVASRAIAGHCQHRSRWKAKHQDLILEEQPASATNSHEPIEEHLYRRQRLLQALNMLKPMETEILTRFYIDEQDKETIRSEMRLSDVQYRLLKSRAKARLIEISRKLRLRENLVGLISLHGTTWTST